MKFTLLSSIAVFTAFGAYSSCVLAAMSESDAIRSVQQAVGDNFSANEIIEILVEDGRSLEQVAEVVVMASSGDTQIELAGAAICASLDREEARAVGVRAIAAAGFGRVTDEIEKILETYDTSGCVAYAARSIEPPAYTPSNSGSLGETLLPPGSPSS